MKVKLIALLLAAGLGVTGIAMTAQAAEAGTRAVNECAHSEKQYVRTDVVESSIWSADRHYVVYKRTYFCPDCKSHVEEYEATYESHEYEQIYYADGRVLSYCTICDYHYFW